MKLPASLLLLTLAQPCLGAAQPTILVFGDSLSAAYGMPRERGWVALLQQAQPDYLVVNASISGETTAGGLRRLDAALRQHRPNIVILELGANDGLRGRLVPDIEADLSELIRQSQRAKAKVLLLGMQLPPNYGADYTRDFRQLYPRLAQRYHVALLPFLLEGVPPERFQADNLHPTAAAQSNILQRILPALKPLLSTTPK